MKKFRNVLLITMLVLSLGIGSAYAGTLTDTSGLAGNGAIANEIFGTGSNVTPIPTTQTLNFTFTAGVPITSDFIVDWTLGNGALWGTAVVVGDLTVSTAGATKILVSGGAITDNTVRFRVNVPVGGIAIADTIDLTFHVKNAQALATPLASIPLTVRAWDLLTDVDTVTGSPFNVLTSANGTTEALAASLVPATGGFKIDVATSNVAFVDAVVADPSFVTTSDVILGTLTITNGAAFEDDAATAWAIGVTNATATGVLSLTDGNFAACITAPGDLIIDRGGLAYSATTITATSASWSLTNAQLIALQAAGAVNIDMLVDGVTPIANQTPKAALTITWTDGTYLADTVAATSLRKLEKNGTTRYLYNIPSPDSATAFATVLIINDSAVDGKIFATITDNNGTQYTAELVSISPLAAGKTVKLTGADIATAVGAPNWPGTKARLEINSETPSLQAQGMITSTSNGVTASTNFSTVAP